VLKNAGPFVKRRTLAIMFPGTRRIRNVFYLKLIKLEKLRDSTFLVLSQSQQQPKHQFPAVPQTSGKTGYL